MNNTLEESQGDDQSNKHSHKGGSGDFEHEG